MSLIGDRCQSHEHDSLSTTTSLAPAILSYHTFSLCFMIFGNHHPVPFLARLPDHMRGLKRGTEKTCLYSVKAKETSPRLPLRHRLHLRREAPLRPGIVCGVASGPDHEWAR